MNGIDHERNRIEQIRWIALDAISHGRPYTVPENLMLSAIQSAPVQCTALELRRELDYLFERGLVELKRPEGALWTAKLTRDGIDVHDYTKDVEPGIARPKKYW